MIRGRMKVKSGMENHKVDIHYSEVIAGSLLASFVFIVRGDSLCIVCNPMAADRLLSHMQPCNRVQ